MTQFAFAFNVDKRHVGDVLEALHRFKVEGLDVRPLVTAGAKGKAGGTPAWQAAAAAATNKPMPRSHFTAALVNGGYTKSAASSGLDHAVQNKALIKSKVGGVVHFKKGGAK